MELRQLKYFVKAAELLSFSEAARSLCVAQSTLSQQVKQLEEELGIQLFERLPHSVELTEAGAEVLPYARRTLYEADTCVAKVRDLGQLASGELNIGVTYSFSPILTETLVAFTRRYPGVKLNVWYRPMAELMDMLAGRSVDFVLAFRPKDGLEGIESHVLFDNHLAVIVREDHPLASMKRVEMTDLARYDLVLPSRGLQARNAFDHCAAPYLRMLNIKVELNEVNIVLELVKHSSMVTILAEATIYNQQGVKAVPLALPSSAMDGCVHMLRDGYRKRSAMEFIHMLEESTAVRARSHGWFV